MTAYQAASERQKIRAYMSNHAHVVTRTGNTLVDCFRIWHSDTEYSDYDFVVDLIGDLVIFLVGDSDLLTWQEAEASILSLLGVA